MALTHPMGVEAVVLCAESGEEVIYLDANGQPVDPMVDCSKCPDCMSNTLLALPVSALAHEMPPALAASHLPAVVPALTLSRHLRPQSRGPPPANPEMDDPAPLAVMSSLGVKLFARPCDRTERAFSEARS